MDTFEWLIFLVVTVMFMVVLVGPWLVYFPRYREQMAREGKSIWIVMFKMAFWYIVYFLIYGFIIDIFGIVSGISVRELIEKGFSIAG